MTRLNIYIGSKRKARHIYEKSEVKSWIKYPEKKNLNPMNQTEYIDEVFSKLVNGDYTEDVNILTFSIYIYKELINLVLDNKVNHGYTVNGLVTVDFLQFAQQLLNTDDLTNDRKCNDRTVYFTMIMSKLSRNYLKLQSKLPKQVYESSSTNTDDNILKRVNDKIIKTIPLDKVGILYQSAEESKTNYEAWHTVINGKVNTKEYKTRSGAKASVTRYLKASSLPPIRRGEPSTLITRKGYGIDYLPLVNKKYKVYKLDNLNVFRTFSTLYEAYQFFYKLVATEVYGESGTKL